MTNEEILGKQDSPSQQSKVVAGAISTSVPMNWAEYAKAREEEMNRMSQAGSDPSGLEEFRQVMRRVGR